MENLTVGLRLIEYGQPSTTLENEEMVDLELLSQQTEQMTLESMLESESIFKKWFNQEKFSDIRFIFEDGRIVYGHKILLSRSNVMRNILLTNETIHTWTIPRDVSVGKFLQFISHFYQNMESINIKTLKLSKVEKQVIFELFGEPNEREVLEIESFPIHFQRFFGEKQFSDAKYLKEDGSEFLLHRLLLSARGEYFSTIFEIGLEETQTGILKFSEFSLNTLDLVLKFIYYFDEKDWFDLENIFELLYASDFLFLTEMTEKCMKELQNHFTNNPTDFETILSILQASHDLNNEKLKETCIAYALETFEQFENQDNFSNISLDLRNELSALKNLQSNPLGKPKSLYRAKEIMAILKESLKDQERNLDLMKHQFQWNQSNYTLRSGMEDDETWTSEENKKGRKRFLDHWKNLIRTQEVKIDALSQYIQKHEKLFESLYEPKTSHFPRK